VLPKLSPRSGAQGNPSEARDNHLSKQIPGLNSLTCGFVHQQQDGRVHVTNLLAKLGVHSRLGLE
jgi:hypothetical protein